MLYLPDNDLRYFTVTNFEFLKTRFKDWNLEIWVSKEERNKTYANSNETTFSERVNVALESRIASCAIIFTRRRVPHALVLACAHFFAHVELNQEVIRAGTYLPRYVVRCFFVRPRPRASTRGGGGKVQGAREMRKRHRAWEGINGIREIITVYIECNLAKRMQRRIEARLRVQGRANWCILLAIKWLG